MLKITNDMPKSNKIQAILYEKGFRQVKPSYDLLTKMGITPHRFNKILRNETELTLSEAIAFSAWLEVPIEKFYETTSLDYSRTEKAVIR